MPRKKAKPEKTEPEAATMPLFRRFPAEIQIMIFHEALRKPQVHFVNVSRQENRPGVWGLTMVSRTKRGDTSGGRLLDNIQEVGVFSPVAAEAIRKSALQSLLLPISVRPRGSWKIDAATDLVVLEFDPDKSGQLRFWHPRNQVSNFLDIVTIRQQLKGIRKVAFVYGGNQQPDAGSSECVFQCLQHHHRRHSKWKFCPEELVGLIYQLSDVEAVYFILQHRINSKVVKDYAASYFSVPAAIRNTFGFKTFYSTTRSYVTVPLPSYVIGPVVHATWKAKECMWTNDPQISLINAARERAMVRPRDSRDSRYGEQTRELSYLGRALDHRDEVWPLIVGMIWQMRADQSNPMSPEWPYPIPPQVDTPELKANRAKHSLRYNLDNLTKERRDNLEFGMLLMVDDSAVCKSGKDKEAEPEGGGLDERSKGRGSVA